jgi:beta-mannanase
MVVALSACAGTAQASPRLATALKPPPIPSKGAYLGAYVKARPSANLGAQREELRELPSFDRTVGRRLRIVHIYTAWKNPAPVQEMTTVSSDGAFPLVDWSCSDSDASVAAGGDDALIRAYARALKAYGKPVFLRWFWEMNFTGTSATGVQAVRDRRCLGVNGASGYVAAWRHIWSIFRGVGATNVAFVWCPGLGGQADPVNFYPGSAYVDWIGIDGYDRQGLGEHGFSTLFATFYKTYLAEGKPIMVAETAATAADQAQYLQGILTSAPLFPDIKAVVYYDAAGPAANWALGDSGLIAFSRLARSSYFQPKA